MIEKKYRSRLNGYFEKLLAAITSKTSLAIGDDDGEDKIGRVSKGKVLVLAIEHIRSLDMQREALKKERKSLVMELERLKSAGDCWLGHDETLVGL